MFGFDVCSQFLSGDFVPVTTAAEMSPLTLNQLLQENDRLLVKTLRIKRNIQRMRLERA